MKLSIRICGTKSYLHVWKHLLWRVVANARDQECVHIVYVSDESKECLEAFQRLKKEVPASWETEHRPLAVTDEFDADKDKAKAQASNLIARLHGEGFAASRLWGADQCWTVEPDVLPPTDALKMMQWAIQMPDDYYGVVYCTYPNNSFIGGFGDALHNIAEDVKEDEREITPELQKRWDIVKKKCAEIPPDKRDEALIAEVRSVGEDIKSSAPKYAHLFERWFKIGYRRGGWMESAYPNVGRGTGVVPVDWCGEGCNLLSKRALAVASYEGFAGGVSQDLFLCWKKYYPAGIRIGCIPHTLCDHVKCIDGKLMHMQAFHELEGEARGHLRMVMKPWVDV